jgi:hypothetical protein
MAISFASDILPLFTEMDIQHMTGQGVDLDKYAYMSDPANGHANAQNVYQQVSSGSMPPSWSGEQPWTEEMVQTFQNWMNGGYLP